ncbi:MAG: hypothetical protein KGI26_06870 [Thaumarchaeota archaeon]|nr:hypothetical protein [Nitrososphaerota archaeon]
MGKQKILRVFVAVAVLATYLVVWFYQGSGDGPYSPYNALFGSRITLYCLPPPSFGCFQLNAWLILAAILVIDWMVLWPVRPGFRPQTPKAPRVSEE